MHILETKGLSKNYGKRHVVKDLNLYVNTGEIVGLLGPNGAGKTTTFYMVVGLIKPEQGKIFLDNEDITRLPMYRRAMMGISYLPQEPSIFRKLTVEDNLKAVLEIIGLRKDEIDVEVGRLLKEFNLTELTKKEGYKLSGGERRKTEIARAIAIKPRFILFDEPFAGIDPIAIIELKKMLNYLESRLELRLSQKLILTPQLQQAIKLLQLPHLELSEFLSQELIENPFLEESVEEIPVEELTQEEKESVEIEEAQEDAEAPLEKIMNFTVDEYFEERGYDGKDLGYFNPGTVSPPSFEQFLTRGPDLYDHLLWQLRFSSEPESIRKIGEVIIGNIDENGYLRASIEELIDGTKTQRDTD